MPLPEAAPLLLLLLVAGAGERDPTQITEAVKRQALEFFLLACLIARLLTPDLVSRLCR